MEMLIQNSWQTKFLLSLGMQAAGDKCRQNSLSDRDAKRMRLTPLKDVKESLNMNSTARKYRSFTISSFFGDRVAASSKSDGDSTAALLLSKHLMESRIGD